MNINPEIYRGYDIRGVVGKDFDEHNVVDMGRALGTLLHKRKIRQCVIGRDSRLSGEVFAESLTKGLVESGVDVIDIGEVMIQMLYFAQYHFQVNASVMITASHNPAEYNGFKISLRYSQTIVEEINELKSIVDSKDFVESQEQGTITQESITDSYTADVLKRVRIHKPLKVVIDSGAGTSGLYAPQIFEAAGCEVFSQHTTPDGSFPVGTPDPTSMDMITRVKERVLAEQADIGFAFDGDGDRLGVVDSKGNILWNDILVALFAQEILERFPGAPIIYNTLCSQVVKKTISQSGGDPVIWRTGHSFIKEKLNEIKAPFAGELSGHFFFADNFYGHDDGTFAALRLLEYITEKETTLHELFEALPKYISSPEIKIGCADSKKKSVIEELSVKFKSDFPSAEITDSTVIPDDDGTRADFEDGMIIFRYSQNGPYLTVKFEAETETVYNERKQYVKEMLKSNKHVDWSDGAHGVNLDSLE